MVQKLRQFYSGGGFCLLVEMDREGSAPRPRLGLSPQGKPVHAVEADPDGGGQCKAGRGEEEEGQAGGGEGELGEVG